MVAEAGHVVRLFQPFLRFNIDRYLRVEGFKLKTFQPFLRFNEVIDSSGNGFIYTCLFQPFLRFNYSSVSAIAQSRCSTFQPFLRFNITRRRMLYYVNNVEKFQPFLRFNLFDGQKWTIPRKDVVSTLLEIQPI